MNHPEWQDALDAYVSGELDTTARESLLLHLKGCTSCREEADTLARIVNDAGALPRSLEPPSHLWWRIAEALREGPQAEPRVPRVRTPSSRFRFALAAAALVAVFGVAVLIAPRGHDATTGTTANAPGSENQPDVVVISDNAKPQPSDWARLIWTLEEESLSAEKAVFTGLAGIDAEALARASVVEPALDALDIAINETVDAMRLEPQNPGLARALTGYYERKLELLRVAARLASGTWA
ncbi:MAG TPA: zf-HC2 domain-containing protein [Dongiaceae bacterium]|nr:zf-HC2 domain-containing protein [Dongiaceae bacterium]